MEWQKIQRLETENASLRASLQRMQEERDETRKQLAISTLSIPLEEDLSDRIDDLLKHLAMQDGYTLNGIARLLVDCQRRMAADWLEVGGLRRNANRAEASLRTLREGQQQLIEKWRTRFYAGE